MQIPKQGSTGVPLPAQLMKYDVCSFGLMELTALAYQENGPQPISVQRWALAAYIWSNPPASWKSGTIRGAEPCLRWLQAQTLFAFCRKGEDVVSICVKPNGHHESFIHNEPRTFCDSGIQTRYFITLCYLKISRHWTENGRIYWVTLTRLELCTSIINVCTAAEDSCMAPGWRITAPTLSFLKHWLWGALLNSGATKYPAAQPP